MFRRLFKEGREGERSRGASGGPAPEAARVEGKRAVHMTERAPAHAPAATFVFASEEERSLFAAAASSSPTDASAVAALVQALERRRADTGIEPNVGHATALLEWLDTEFTAACLAIDTNLANYFQEHRPLNETVGESWVRLLRCVASYPANNEALRPRISTLVQLVQILTKRYLSLGADASAAAVAYIERLLTLALETVEALSEYRQWSSLLLQGLAGLLGEMAARCRGVGSLRFAQLTDGEAGLLRAVLGATCVVVADQNRDTQDWFVEFRGVDALVALLGSSTAGMPRGGSNLSIVTGEDDEDEIVGGTSMTSPHSNTDPEDATEDHTTNSHSTTKEREADGEEKEERRREDENQREFELQMACLKALLTVSLDQAHIADYVASHGGLHRAIEFVFWAAGAFPGRVVANAGGDEDGAVAAEMQALRERFAAPEVDDEALETVADELARNRCEPDGHLQCEDDESCPLEVRQLCKPSEEVALVFETLLQFCFLRNAPMPRLQEAAAAAGEEKFVPYLSRGGSTARLLAQAVVDLELVPLQYRIVQTVVDLFDSTVCADSPVVAAGRASAMSKDAAPQLQQCTLDFLGQFLDGKPSALTFCHDYRVFDVFFSPFFFFRSHALAANVLAFVRFAATMDESSMTGEVKYLLSVLDAPATDLDSVLLVCDTMTALFRHRETKTQLAMIRVDGATALLRAFARQEAWPGQTAILYVLEHLLNRRDGRRFMLVRGPVSVIFSLVLDEEPAVRLFGLRAVLRLLLAVPAAQARREVLTPTEVTLLDPSDLGQDAVMQRLREARAALVNKFVESIPHNIEQHETVRALLQGIRNVLRVHTREHQALLDQGQCALHVINFLSCMVSSPRLVQEAREDRTKMCIEALRTLTALMANNAVGQELFRQDIGHSVLTDLLLRAEDRQPSPALFAALFDMLVQGKYDPEERYIFQNQDVVVLMFDLLPHCSTRHKVEFMTRFTSAVARSSLNQTYCCNVQLIEKVLELFPDLPYVREDEMKDSSLLAEYPRVPQGASLLLGPDDMLHKRAIELMQILGGHSITVKHLKRFFGLMKPVDHQAATAKHLKLQLRSPYAAALLESLEAMTKKEGPNNFFYFDGLRSGLQIPKMDRFPRDGFSFSTWLRVESYDHPKRGRNAAPYEPRLFSFASKNGRCLDVYFDASRRLTVLVGDNKKRTQSKFEFAFKPGRWFHVVLTQTNRTFGFVGDSTLCLYVDGRLKQTFEDGVRYPNFNEPVHSCFVGAGQGAPSFYGQMGPVYFFERALEEKQVETMFWLGPSYMFTFEDVDAELCASICLSYNSKARDGEIFLDNTPRQAAMHAKPLAGTHQCVTRHIKDVLHCLGGISIMFPLLAQLDYPTLTPEGKITHEVDTQLLINIVRVLVVMIRDNPINQNFFQRIDGFGVMAYVFQQVSPLNLTVGAVEALESLVSVVSFNREFKRAAFEKLFLDFRLWIYTGPDVQEQWLNAFDASFSREADGVQKALDQLRTVCWLSSPEPGSTATHEVLYHPVTGVEMGRRPNTARMRHIRRRVLATVAREVPLVEFEELRAIVFAVKDAAEPDLITLLVDLLNTQSARVLRFLSDLHDDSSDRTSDRLLAYTLGAHRRHGMDLFVSLVQCREDEARVAALRAVAKLLRAGIKADETSLFLTIQRHLRPYPLSMGVYLALFSIMLAEDIRSSHSFVLDGSQPIMYPTVFKIVFRLLPQAESVKVKQTVLQDTLFLLKNDSNRISVLATPGWQELLLDTLCEDPTVNAFVLQVLQAQLLFSLKKRNWKPFETTLAWIAYKQPGDHVTRQLLEDLGHVLVREAELDVEGALMPGVLARVAAITHTWRQQWRDWLGLAATDAEAQLCAELSVNEEEAVEALIRQQQESGLEESKTTQSARQQASAVDEEHRQREANRRAVVSVDAGRERRRQQASWRQLIRALTNERGPWSHRHPKDTRIAKIKPGSHGSTWQTDEDVQDAIRRAERAEGDRRVFWKLDRTENRARMRMKLKRNYEGSTHREATLVDDMTKRAQEQQHEGVQGQGGGGDHGEEGAAEEGEEKAYDPLLQTAMQLSRALSEEGAEEEAIEEGSTGDLDGGWDVVSPTAEEKRDGSMTSTITQPDVETVVLEDDECWLQNISLMTVGTLRLTTTHLYFEPRESFTHDKRRVDKPSKDRQWALAELTQLLLRRYQLRKVALEAFFLDKAGYFFRFESEERRNRVYQKIVARRPRRLKLIARGGSPRELLRKSGVTELWRRRQISNFEYLMFLNTFAGRTYNDLSQYPVFPWVIADYESEELDLHNPKKYRQTYRDLSKPVGALNPSRLQFFLDRFNSLENDEAMPRFHYGTHYSSAGTVLFYLLRLEPFASQAILIQDGHFDHADRLFDSIPGAWIGCFNNAADVKELIPEFFYLPEFLRNANSFDLGTKQSATEPIGDVVLPPWAKTAEEFVRINREALESEYVSEHLDEWIDLVFGYKQRGQAAIDAHNVFFHLTYEGSVNIDSIKDEALREATISQIEHFGQTPSQLLTGKHPKRYDPDRMLHSVFRRPDVLQLYVQKPITMAGKHAEKNPLLFLRHCSDRILTLGLDRLVGIHKWRNVRPEYDPPFSFDVERPPNKPRQIGVHFAVGLTIYPWFFAVTRDGKHLYSCGHWDNSFKCSLVETGDFVQSVSQHKDVVTCLSLDDDETGEGQILVTGSKDTTIMVWRVGGEMTHPMHVLYGHDDEVTCVCVKQDLDLVVSGSKDGSVIVHTLRKGMYVLTLYPPDDAGIRWVAVSANGSIVVYTKKLGLHVFSINGRHLFSSDAHERLYAFCFSRDGDFLITGGVRRTLVIRRVCDLHIVFRFEPVASCIRSIDVVSDEQHLLVGLQSGVVLIYAIQAAYLRKRTLDKLVTLGF